MLGLGLGLGEEPAERPAEPNHEHEPQVGGADVDGACKQPLDERVVERAVADDERKGREHLRARAVALGARILGAQTRCLHVVLGAHARCSHVAPRQRAARERDAR